MNTDQIERNTFVGNLREAIVVLADSKPSIVDERVRRASSGDQLLEGQDRRPGQRARQDAARRQRVFWKNRRLIDSGGADQPLLRGRQGRRGAVP
jgi:hypothetical protein